jgi:ureidoglycolate hydrolase
MIEQYRLQAAGYSPFLIRPGWQIAELRYAHALRFGAVARIERHLQTDEAFIALDGRPVLGAVAHDGSGTLSLDVKAMDYGVTYNIPQGVWHTICLSPGDVVLIVERSETHMQDVEYRDLSVAEAAQVNRLLMEALR